jgi:hypothetical protein
VDKKKSEAKTGISVASKSSSTSAGAGVKLNRDHFLANVDTKKYDEISLEESSQLLVFKLLVELGVIDSGIGEMLRRHLGYSLI